MSINVRRLIAKLSVEYYSLYNFTYIYISLYIYISIEVGDLNIKISSKTCVSLFVNCNHCI